MGPSIIWSNDHTAPRLAKPNLNLNHLLGFHDEASRLQAFYYNGWLWRLGVCSISQLVDVFLHIEAFGCLFDVIHVFRWFLDADSIALL